jgi:hypothetical protein
MVFGPKQRKERTLLNEESFGYFNLATSKLFFLRTWDGLANQTDFNLVMEQEQDSVYREEVPVQLQEIATRTYDFQEYYENEINKWGTGVVGAGVVGALFGARSGILEGKQEAAEYIAKFKNDLLNAQQVCSDYPVLQ